MNPPPDATVIHGAVLDWIQVVGTLLISWPAFALLFALLFRKPIKALFERLTHSSDSKAKIGPIELELGKLAEQGQQAVENLNRLNLLMAESRLLELEITESKFAGVFTPEQQRRMRSQIDELRALTNDRNA
jgi:hypothetical protein